mmetsp:Transcript_23968/g.59755  ORF Transcript_23968/g.59755 Transcript_23968/m.59755 type:complete len:101 (+) Transcript_23968:52-354(+)
MYECRASTSTSTCGVKQRSGDAGSSAAWKRTRTTSGLTTSMESLSNLLVRTPQQTHITQHEGRAARNHDGAQKACKRDKWHQSKMMLTNCHIQCAPVQES